MAPSSNYTLLVALLVAFAVVAPSLLHQSAAARDGGAAKAGGAATSEVALHPTTSYEIPDLPRRESCHALPCFQRFRLSPATT